MRIFVQKIKDHLMTDNKLEGGNEVRNPYFRGDEVNRGQSTVNSPFIECSMLMTSGTLQSNPIRPIEVMSVTDGQRVVPNQ